MKDINGKNYVNFVPSVMQSVQVKVLKSFSVNIAVIFRVRESVAAKSDKLTLNTLKFLSSVEVIIIIIPYFSIDNAHLMCNAHPKLFRHSF